jgi:hypothetical protein
MSRRGNACQLVLWQVSAADPVAEQELHRAIDPTLLTPDDWRSKKAVADSLAARIAALPHLMVVGSEDDLLSR